MIILDGTHLTIPDVIKVAREHEPVKLSEASRRAVDKARAFVDEKLEQQAVVYGLTTGFGKFSESLTGSCSRATFITSGMVR